MVKREINKTQKTKKTRAVLYLCFSERYSIRENLQYWAAAHPLCAISSSVALSAEGESMKAICLNIRGTNELL